MNITDPIWRTMHAWPALTALVHQGRLVSYGGLRATVEKLVTRLHQAGVRRGDCVGVSCAEPAPHLSLVLALARIGAISTPLGVAYPAEVRKALLSRNAMRFCVRDDSENWTPPAPIALQCIAAGALFAKLDGETSTEARFVDDGANPVWRIFLSSGTTGVSKSVPWRHQQASLHQALHSSIDHCLPGSRLLVLMDLNVAMNRCLRQLVGGGTLVFSTGAQPQEFFDVLRADRPNSLLTTPAILADLFGSRTTLERAYASPLKLVTLAGSAVPPALIRAIRSELCLQVRVVYGSTEMGLLAIADAQVLDSEPNSTGRLLPWVEGEAVNGEGETLPPGAGGILRFRSQVMSDAYLDDPQASALAFKDGGHYPGDLGAIDARGYVYLQGRTDDRINLQGIKLDPFSVEQVLLDYPGVQDAGVFALATGSGLLQLAALMVHSEPIELEKVQQWCRDRLGAQLVPHKFASVSKLPRTRLGKLDREALGATGPELLQSPAAGPVARVASLPIP